MRSVHTAASVHSHCGGTSLPCLAKGTPGSLICSCVSFTLPPSCPLSLHGHYPLHRYHEDSDSCPAPSSTETGILDSRTMHFWTFRLHPRYAPLFRQCFFAPGRLGLRLAFDRYRRFFGLRTFLAVSSVAYSRIEFVAWVAIGPISSADYPFTSSCSPPHLAVTQLLSVTGVKLRQRGTSTLQCTLALKRTRVPAHAGLGSDRWNNRDGSSAGFRRSGASPPGISVQSPFNLRAMSFPGRRLHGESKPLYLTCNPRLSW